MKHLKKDQETEKGESFLGTSLSVHSAASSPSLTFQAPGVTLENETSQSQGRAATPVREVNAQRQAQVVRVIGKEDNEERCRKRWGEGGTKSNC